VRFLKIIFVHQRMFLSLVLGGACSVLLGVPVVTAAALSGIGWFGWMIYLAVSGDLPVPDDNVEVEDLEPTPNVVAKGTYAFLEIHAPEGEETAIFTGDFSLVKDKETGRTVLVSHISPKEGVRIVPLDPESEDTRELIARVAAEVINGPV